MEEPSNIWGVIAIIITTLGGILIAYFQYRKPKDVSNDSPDLKQKIKILETENLTLKKDIIKLSEEIKKMSAAHSEYEIKTSSALIQYKQKMNGMLKSTDLVLGHVVQYIDNDQQQSLLNDLRQTIRVELG